MAAGRGMRVEGAGMSLNELRERVFLANRMLVDSGLVVLTWGNASGVDREKGLVVIKPSGLPYADMRPDNLVVTDLLGKVVEGSLRPSSDLPTHLELYRAWPDIGGVAHTHSPCATAYAQAGVGIPCLGTTHADFCPGTIPCVRALTRAEVEGEYEANTGKAVVGHYRDRKLPPLTYPGALLAHHGPFAWGKTPRAAAEHALILESVARIAELTRRLNPAVSGIPAYITQKHYLRKHGPDAYYGQG